MALTITQTTINTGSTTFSDVADFLAFVNDFSIVQQFVEINRYAREIGNLLDVTVVQQAPNVFVHTRKVINETVDAEIKSSFSSEAFQALFGQLGWTTQVMLSYEYN